MGATIAAFGETWLSGYLFFCNAPTTTLKAIIFASQRLTSISI